jgi:hypothetical protein
MLKHSETPNEQVKQIVNDKEANHHQKNSKHGKSDSASFFGQIDDYLHDFLVERAPELPENVKETFVKFMPIINMVVIFTSIYSAFLSIYYVLLLQKMNILSSGVFGYGYLGQGNALSSGLSIAVYGFVLYFLCKAQMGLQAKQSSAWKFLVFAQLINTVIAILSFSLPWLFGNLITLYILYQIKSYYKAK